MNDHPCDFTLRDQDDKDWTLYDHFGDVIVLDFSTEWCGYCRIAAQEVEAIQTAYAGQDLTYVTILVEDQYGDPADTVDASEWATTYGITSSPVLVGNRDIIETSEHDGWSISGWPTFFFIDREMKTSFVMRGYSSEVLLDTIQSLVSTEEE